MHIYIYIYKISIHICTCIYVYTLVCTHPQAGGKLQVLDRLLTISLSEGSRMLIFSQWTLTLDVLVEFCETRFGPEGVGYLRLDGVLYVCVCLWLCLSSLSLSLYLYCLSVCVAFFLSTCGLWQKCFFPTTCSRYHTCVCVRVCV